MLSFVWDELLSQKDRKWIALYMAYYPMAKVALQHCVGNCPTLQPKFAMYFTVAAKGQGHCGSEPYNPVASNNACSSRKDYASLCHMDGSYGFQRSRCRNWEENTVTTPLCHTMLCISPSSCIYWCTQHAGTTS